MARDVLVRHRGRVVVGVGLPDDDGAHAHRRPRRGPPGALTLPDGAPTLAVEPYDLGTWRATFPDAVGMLRDDYREWSLEGPPVLNYPDVQRNNATLLASALARSPMAHSGRLETEQYRLQADAQTGRTESTYELVGPYGYAAAGLGYGAPDWHARPSLEQQKAALARLKRDETVLLDFDAVRRQAGELAALEAERWVPESDARVHRPGTLEMRAVEGPYALKFDCPYQFEPFAVGDPAFARDETERSLMRNYKVTRVPSYYGAEVTPEFVNMTSYRATRLEVYHAPQVQRVVWDYLSGYVFSAYVLQTTYFKSNGQVTLRAPFYPEIFRPVGVAHGDLAVNEVMSARLRETTGYKIIRLQDIFFARALAIFGVFLAERVQARFALYDTHLQGTALCAIIRLARPNRADWEDYYVWRRETLFRDPTKLEVNGFFDEGVQPGIQPWLANFFAEGSKFYTATIDQGI